MSKLLIIFAKAPEPGRVKTRMVPHFTQQEAAMLQEALILDSLHFTEAVDAKRTLACSPDTEHVFFRRCEKIKTQAISFISQKKGDLGKRMQCAFDWAFSEGFQKVVIMGSDSPTLPTKFIQRAFRELESRSLILGPSRDGGYYLIGAKPPLPDLFSKIHWGTDRVLIQTLERLNAIRRPYVLLPFWYDIDRPDDLDFLKAHLAYLGQNGSRLPQYTLDFITRQSSKKNP